MTENLIDRLRTAANEIDDMGDVELRSMLAEAAETLEQFEFAGRWSADCARQAEAARQEALAEVEHLKAKNERLRAALEAARDDLQHWGGYAPEYFKEKHNFSGDIAQIEAELKAAPTQSLAEIEAHAVESILQDLRSDIPDTNTARRIFQRLQLRVDVLRHNAKAARTPPLHITAGDPNTPSPWTPEKKAELDQAIKKVREAETADVARTKAVCNYPDCNCPFDAPADPNWCARGLRKAAQA